MYNILIIDDQDFKIKDIVSKLNKKIIKYDFAMDLLNAKEKIKEKKYDVIFLDMTLSDGISNNEFVGIDVLNHLDYLEIDTPVIVVTQFYNFNDLSCSAEKADFFLENERYNQELNYDFSSNSDIHELPNLHLYLSENFENYFGCVLYIQNNPIWVKGLKSMLYKLGGKEYENIVIG